MKIRLAVILFSILFIIGICGTFWGNQIAGAASGLWNSCPRGETNCAYPGKCRSYIDTNGDRICDRSQPAPRTSTSVPSVAAASMPAATTTPGTSADSILSAVLPPDNSSTKNSSIVDPAVEIAGSSSLEINKSYYFLPILLVTGILYAITWTLSSRRIIRNLLHRKIWNIILLISMLLSALLGVFLILNIDFNFNIILPFNMLFWHVEAGIALSVIAVFHILWHWRYFSKLFRTA